MFSVDRFEVTSVFEKLGHIGLCDSKAHLSQIRVDHIRGLIILRFELLTSMHEETSINPPLSHVFKHINRSWTVSWDSSKDNF